MNKRCPKKYVLVNCGFCNKPLHRWPYEMIEGRKHYCNPSCQMKDQSPLGKDHKWWKGGNPNIDPCGYIRIRIFENGERKYVNEHRYKMEKFLKRKLTPNEHVHHINGNKQDNRIENLVVMTIAEHTIEHRPRRKNYGIGRPKCVIEDCQRVGVYFQKYCKGHRYLRRFIEQPRHT